MRSGDIPTRRKLRRSDIHQQGLASLTSTTARIVFVFRGNWRSISCVWQNVRNIMPQSFEKACFKFITMLPLHTLYSSRPFDCDILRIFVDYRSKHDPSWFLYMLIKWKMFNHKWSHQYPPETCPLHQSKPCTANWISQSFCSGVLG